MDRRLEHHFRRFRRRGDPRSLGRVFDLSAGELATIARQLVRDPETAEDIVQATSLTAIEKAHVFDGRQRVMPWLIGILARHAARARVAASRTPDPDRLDRAPVRDPADDAANAELGALIDERIADLPDGYASAVRPYLVEGKRPMEIGRALGITANAASVRVHRGLELLRRRLPRTAAPAVAVAMPDLALVREKVIASLPAPSIAAGATATATSAAAGVLTMKKSVLLVAGGALLGSGATRAIETLIERGRERGLTLGGWTLGASLLKELETATLTPSPQVEEIEQVQLGGGGLWLRAEPGEDPGQAATLAHIIAKGCGVKDDEAK